MGDTFAVDQALSSAGPSSAVIVGAGYIGLEMAEALTTRGLAVTLVEAAARGHAHRRPRARRPRPRRTGPPRRRRCSPTPPSPDHPRTTPAALTVTATGPGEPLTATADLVLVVVGVRPDTDLAVAAGAQTGVRGRDRGRPADAHQPARRVRRRGLRAHLPSAARAPRYLPLGTTAHKQGRVAGENAVGGTRAFAGSLGTQVVKVFDLVAARTGLRDHEAAAAAATTRSPPPPAADDHKAYYPGATPIHIRITGDRTHRAAARRPAARAPQRRDRQAHRHLRHRPVPPR